MRKVLILCLLVFMISCGKEDDVKGCWVFTVVQVWECYPAVSGCTKEVDTFTGSKCDLTESEAGAYSKGQESVSTLNGIRITTTCTYKKQ